MKMIDGLTGALLVLAGLNCGLIAVLQRDLLTENSPTTALTRLFFALVGAAALYRLLIALAQPKKSAPGRTLPY